MSSVHDLIIDEMLNWTKANFPVNEKTLVHTDTTEGHDLFEKPRKIFDSIPDIYIRHMTEPKYRVIGEAKTRRDKDLKHLKEQLSDYLRFISIHKETHFCFFAQEPIFSIGNKLIERSGNSQKFFSEKRIHLVEYPDEI